MSPTRTSLKDALRRHHETAPVALVLPPHLLLVEDDEAMTDLLVTVLEESGYRVTVLAAAWEMVHALRSGALSGPDLWDVACLVTDYHMCGATGLDLAEATRRAGWMGPIVIISAFASAALVREAERVGVQYVLEKPFELRELLRVVGALVPPGAARRM